MVRRGGRGTRAGVGWLGAWAGSLPMVLVHWLDLVGPARLGFVPLAHVPFFDTVFDTDDQALSGVTRQANLVLQGLWGSRISRPQFSTTSWGFRLARMGLLRSTTLSRQPQLGQLGLVPEQLVEGFALSEATTGI